MSETTSITGLILAGGRGRRINGADKGLLELSGRSLATHTLSRLAAQTERQVISANRSAQQYQVLGVPVLADRRADYPGPLAGIETAMQQVDSAFLLVVPCDSPLLPLDLAPRLLQALQDQVADIAIARNGERPQFLHALIPCRLREDLTHYLDQGQRAVFGWYQCHKVVEVDFSDQPEGFMNINTLEELQAIQLRMAEG